MANYNQNFKIQKINDGGSDCDFGWEVVLNPGQSKQVHRADDGDTITFKRVGPDLNNGFTIDFETGGPADQTIAAGNNEWVMTIDSANEGDWYYGISVPDAGVRPLDPVIIINPDEAFDFWLEIIIFGAGFLFALFGSRLWNKSSSGSGG